MGSRPWSFNRGSRHEGPADQSSSGLGVSISGSRSGIISTVPGPDMLLCSCRACCISLYCAAAAPAGGRQASTLSKQRRSLELAGDNQGSIGWLCQGVIRTTPRQSTFEASTTSARQHGALTCAAREPSARRLGLDPRADWGWTRATIGAGPGQTSFNSSPSIALSHTDTRVRVDSRGEPFKHAAICS